jgi:hypothetical protein
VSRYQYRAFGLILQTNRRLPDLMPAQELPHADVACEIDVSEIGTRDGDTGAPPSGLPWNMESPPRHIWKAHTSEGTYLRLRYSAAEGHVEFVINPGGSLIWVSSSGTATLMDVAALLLGPVLGCVLRHRGVACLHGSVVSVDGRAHAFVGAKGAGKSTTALVLLKRGATVLSDDLVVLATDGERFGVRPGQPRLRLRCEPATVLCGSYEGLPALWSRAENRPRKRALEAVSSGDEVPADVVPLAAIHVLEPCGEGDRSPSIAVKPALWSLTKLMAHRYASFVLDRAGHERDFELLSRLAASVPVRQLKRPSGLDTLPAVADLILHHAKGAA